MQGKGARAISDSPYFSIVATEIHNVILNPLKGSELIVIAKVQYFALACLDALREPKRSEAIIDAHEQNWSALAYQVGMLQWAALCGPPNGYTVAHH